MRNDHNRNTLFNIVCVCVEILQKTTELSCVTEALRKDNGAEVKRRYCKLTSRCTDARGTSGTAGTNVTSRHARSKRNTNRRNTNCTLCVQRHCLNNKVDVLAMYIYVLCVTDGRPSSVSTGCRFIICTDCSSHVPLLRHTPVRIIPDAKYPRA